LIRYNLTCENDHNFESWFRDSTSCDDQIKLKNVFCPECNTNLVTKALMSPRIPKKGSSNTQKNTVLSHGRSNILNNAIEKLEKRSRRTQNMLVKNFLKRQERFIIMSQNRDQSMVRHLQKISKNYMKKA